MPDRISLRLRPVPGILVFDSLIDASFARRRGTSLAVRFALGCSIVQLWITPAGYARLKLSAAHGHHEGVLVVRYDNNPRNNMSAGDIARAVRNLANAGVSITDCYYELNHWQ